MEPSAGIMTKLDKMLKILYLSAITCQMIKISDSDIFTLRLLRARMVTVYYWKCRNIIKYGRARPLKPKMEAAAHSSQFHNTETVIAYCTVYSTFLDIVEKSPVLRKSKYIAHFNRTPRLHKLQFGRTVTMS